MPSSPHWRRRRRLDRRPTWPCAAVLVLVTLLAPRAFAEPPRGAFEGVEPSHWRVVWTFDPAREATVSWDTAQSGSEHVVYYDRAPRDGNLTAYAEHTDAKRNGRYSTLPEHAAIEAYYHHAELRDLEPDTTYYFVMVSDGKVSPEFHFRTAPVEDASFKLLYGGDSRSQAEMRQAMNGLMAKLFTEHPDVLALVHGGDYINRGEHLDEWLEWLTDHELTVTEDRRILPVIPTRGNHDKGPNYAEVFNTPGGEQHYWTSSFGPRCRIITLNTELSTAGDQASWLREELDQARPKVRWLLAGYHRPAWPGYKEASGARQHWVPLFEEFDVDLVLESDGHVLKRTLPIRNEKHDPTGVTYVGEGGLGVKPRTPNKDLWYLQAPGFADSGHHVHLLTFGAESLRLQAIMMDGTVRDDWLLSPRQPSSPARAAR